MPLSPPPITTPLPDKESQSQVSWPWLRWFQELQQKINQLEGQRAVPANVPKAKE